MFKYETYEMYYFNKGNCSLRQKSVKNYPFITGKRGTQSRNVSKKLKNAKEKRNCANEQLMSLNENHLFYSWLLDSGASL